MDPGSEAVADHTERITSLRDYVFGGGAAISFLTTFRRTPTAKTEGWIESRGGVGKASVGRVFGYVQIGTDPRRSPSACSEI